MGKYLLQVTYTPEGLKGLASEGAASRVAYISEFTKSIGGTVESFNFSFGEYDAYLVVDAPDDVDITAASLAVGAAGGASIDTVKLLTAEQVDAAIAKLGSYRAPGA